MSRERDALDEIRVLATTALGRGGSWKDLGTFYREVLGDIRTLTYSDDCCDGHGPVIAEHYLFHQWGHDGKHRHGGMVGMKIHGIVHEGDPHGLHHHHDDLCKAPPIMQLMAWWCGCPVYAVISAMKAAGMPLGGSRRG